MSDSKLKVTVDVANVPAVVQIPKEAQEAIDALRAELVAAQAQTKCGETMNDELKPCPFCRGEANAEQTDEGNWFVFCYSKEGCDARPQVWAFSYDEAVTAWNQRPVEDALRAELAAAQEENARLRAKVDYLECALNGAESDTHKALSAFNELDAKWDSVPWEVLGYVISVVRAWSEDRQITADAVDWFNANAPRTEDQP